MLSHNTWHFEASKWHLHRSDVVIVDETGTRFQVLHHAMGSSHIPMPKVELALRSVFFLSKFGLNSRPQAYRVKTPAARPMVVSLALCSTSPSDSNDNTDMTGPKISSFTQVMSSVQFATTKENTAGKWTHGVQIEVVACGITAILPSTHGAM